MNRAFTWLIGYSAVEAVGQNPRLLRSGQHDADFYAAVWHHLKTDERLVWRDLEPASG